MAPKAEVKAQLYYTKCETDGNPFLRDLIDLNALNADSDIIIYDFNANKDLNFARDDPKFANLIYIINFFVLQIYQ
jgi:hypothetical protein